MSLDDLEGPDYTHPGSGFNQAERFGNAIDKSDFTARKPTINGAVEAGEAAAQSKQASESETKESDDSTQPETATGSEAA